MREASAFGTSEWTRTARIVVELEDGGSKEYFVKVRGLLMRGIEVYLLTVDSVLPREGRCMSKEAPWSLSYLLLMPNSSSCSDEGCQFRIWYADHDPDL